MLKIGLTGGIASGKSTVIRFLQDMGLATLSLDEISHQILLPGTSGYCEVLAIFGQNILLPSKEINRQALGQIIFGDCEKRKKLEKITHPLIIQEMCREISKLEKAGENVVIVEVPLLVEAGMMEEFDQIWLVYADEEQQLARLRSRDGLKIGDAELRLKAQLPLKEKRAYADEIIHNTGDLEILKTQLKNLWRKIACRDWH